jgi:hypothetical protein
MRLFIDAMAFSSCLVSSGRGQRHNLSSISRLLQQLHNGDENQSSNGMGSTKNHQILQQLCLEPEVVDDGKSTETIAAVSDTAATTDSLESHPAVAAAEDVGPDSAAATSAVDLQLSESNAAADCSTERPIEVKKIKKQVVFNHSDEVDADKREAEISGENELNNVGTASKNLEDYVSSTSSRRSSRKSSNRRKLSFRWKQHT